MSGSNKERITYNQLSLVQWMAGFCRTMRDESNIEIRNNMLDYVINLLDGVQDFSWSSAEANHAVLLCRMEQDVSGWPDTDRTDRIQRPHAQRHFPQTVQKKCVVNKVTPCVYFSKILVFRNKLMRPDECFINTLVLHVGHQIPHLRLQEVVKKQVDLGMILSFTRMLVWIIQLGRLFPALVLATQASQVR